MKKILVVVDMQNDFIDGSLGTKEAEAIVEPVAAKIMTYPTENIYATRDTHPVNYLDTQEGKKLPVEHCIEGTFGWEINEKVAAALKHAVIINKPTFGSEILAETLAEENKKEEIAVELVGLCTDICVVSNALLLKAKMPEISIMVDPSCCAGVTPETHDAALQTMKMCQIEIERSEK
ncbi:MAG: cysteine hydrolase [Lachnospiraceae bacterium]|nr:cysteine hydrolase [Lachnospiraceae bacterium]